MGSSDETKEALIGTSQSPTLDVEKASKDATAAFMGERKQRRLSKEDPATTSASASVAITSSTADRAIDPNLKI